MKLRKNDNVIVVSGKDRNKKGRILSIDHARQRVVVERVNLVKKTTRRRSQNDRGGIIDIEASIHISNVMAIARDGKPSRVGYKIDQGKKVRILKRGGELYEGGN